MRCLIRLIFVMMVLSLGACAHVVQHPLQEIKGNTNVDNISAYSAEHQTPIVYVKGVAYALNVACYDNRFYSYDLEKRQYNMNTEDRDYQAFKEDRLYDKSLQQRQYAYFDEERLYAQYKLDRSYMMHTEERMQRGFNEERLYAEELENRHYAVFQDTLYCISDKEKHSLKIVRANNDLLADFDYMYKGRLIKSENGIVVLD